MKLGIIQTISPENNKNMLARWLMILGRAMPENAINPDSRIINNPVLNRSSINQINLSQNQFTNAKEALEKASEWKKSFATTLTMVLYYLSEPMSNKR